jgi:peptidoglycan LD-endopeptidase CwlK
MGAQRVGNEIRGQVRPDNWSNISRRDGGENGHLGLDGVGAMNAIANKKAVQAALGLTADGDFGPKTFAALDIAAGEGRVTIAGKVAAPSAPVLINAPDTNITGDKDLRGVHPALVGLVGEAAKRLEMQFDVIEGVRTIERQRELVARGASKTMNSRHLTGHAVDLWPMKDGKRLPAGTKEAEAALWAALRVIAATVKQVAKERGVMIEWGGDWGWDAPHFQLNRAAYP